ncbi:SemiSWEET transporter [Gayadomonas joobiniege]|uniref:SemiSWEET transporter n=1 Tax=Gayadomonas joobiniege TaxID=1234606 RepID=UPI00037BDAE3|nr:SemiSWEET transporter [Gayadomonas joobiniege]
MSNIELLGFVSAFLTTISFLPQAIQVIKTRNTESLSLAMYSLFTFGVAAWTVYGFMIGNIAVIAANIITFVLAAIILTIKIINELNKRQVVDETLTGKVQG